MRKSLWTMVAVLALTGLLLAQGHNNATEKRVSDFVIVVSDVKIGTDFLKAGEYRVTCDATKVTFIRVSDGKRVLEKACQGKELPKDAETTVMFTDLDRNGARYVQKLLLRGSNVEHVFN
jgi:hypothetical protein